MTDQNPSAPEPEKRVYRKTPPATPAVQAWLDGEQPREGLETADEQETAELWARINKEAEQLRNRHTPIHVQSRILSSLPETPIRPVPDEVVEKPPVSTPVAVVIGILIVAVGAFIGFVMVR